jgi:putative glutamine amidotransferase
MRLELHTRRFYLGRDYSEAVEAAGGIPVLIPLIPKRDYIDQVVDDLDGILLPGSNTDVDPHFYGEEPSHELGTVIPEKDETDLMVLDVVERRAMPLLAICYGMQALNVSRGGTLVQDIRSQLTSSIKHEQGEPATRSSHLLKVGETGVLSALRVVIEAKAPLRVNSSHHQAVGKIGRDLVDTAWATDGVIECIEDTRTDRFVLGVQWHPELSANTDPLSDEIFDHFISRCKTIIKQ